MTAAGRRVLFGLLLMLGAPAAWPQRTPAFGPEPAPATTATDALAVIAPSDTPPARLHAARVPPLLQPVVGTTTRSGRDIYARFHDGLADPDCTGTSSPRWLRQFSTAPADLARSNTNLLALFGYVVDALRAANLPTEYALIPFVESGYKPGARSPGGPAGLWQMIALTARDHAVPVRAGYDGRLSPIDSTRAAVRYLKTLHGLFAGDWRLTVMAYNAGEYRVFSALRQSGQVARTADPEKLVGMPDISRAYVRKLHALSCLFDRADDHDDWMQALDRQVPVLTEIQLPPGVSNLPAWATRNGWDATDIERLNPAFAGGRIEPSTTAKILAPMQAENAAGDR